MNNGPEGLEMHLKYLKSHYRRLLAVYDYISLYDAHPTNILIAIIKLRIIAF